MHTQISNNNTSTLSSIQRGMMIMAGVAMITTTSMVSTGGSSIQSSFLNRGRVEFQASSAPVASKEVRSKEDSTLAERARQRALKRMAKAAVVQADTQTDTLHMAAPVAIDLSVEAPTLQPAAPAEQVATFGRTVFPVSHVPNWGDMRSPAEWNRSYAQMTEQDFVDVPAYDLSRLTIPLKSILKKRDAPESIALITEKLFYSTRHFGSYNLDAAEFTSIHPGIDLKLAEGTPIGAIAGGTVQTVETKEATLGLHVIIEHQAPNGTYYYSIYGHLSSSSVQEGQVVAAGDIIGLVGMTGNTSGAHLHLQVDTSLTPHAKHTPYWPASMPSKSDAEQNTINPIRFIETH